jgi:Mg2+ and Co2+ transporter CorA
MKSNPSPRRIEVRAWADRVFSDRLMTELALLLIPAIVIPLVFQVSAVSKAIFGWLNAGIIVVFVVEYALKLVIAESRWRFVRNPWRVLDLMIILLAAVDFIPILPIKGWRASPMLRLLRLARVFAATGRTMKGVAPRDIEPCREAIRAPARFRLFSEKDGMRESSPEEVETALAGRRDVWVDIQGIRTDDLAALSRIFGIPKDILESNLFRHSFPNIDHIRGSSIVTLWNNRWTDAACGPAKDEGETPRVLIIGTAAYLATLSVSPNSFVDTFAARDVSFLRESFSLRALHSIFKQRIEEDKTILQALEQEVAKLEESSGGQKSPKFLEKSFLLKKPIQREGYNLRHFCQVLRKIDEREIQLPGLVDESRTHFVILHNEAESLNDYCQNIREDLKSLIDLQINKVSFDLNRVMRFLAVISCLALIPTIIGGLLGQNVLGQPFKVSLLEIFFFVFFLMLIGLYIFYRKGWLK